MDKKERFVDKMLIDCGQNRRLDHVKLLEKLLFCTKLCHKRDLFVKKESSKACLHEWSQAFNRSDCIRTDTCPEQGSKVLYRSSGNDEV